MQKMREYYFCKKHGDLSTEYQKGGIHLYRSKDSKMLQQATDDNFCPQCFSEWLAKQFPVELRNET
jgi:hypothetical protein